MAYIQSFMPVGNADAKVLILGSIPGKKSLEQNQYYAHPLNSFWTIMGELAGAGPDLSYDDRLNALESCGIALWDVLASCKRETSQDAHIREESANDFASFFACHPHIARVFFNGSKAEQCFRRLVQGKQTLPSLRYHRLPSTSPAHAGMRYADKLQAWRAIMNP
jgi:TDG/mug DNA glycosylase family protein